MVPAVPEIIMVCGLIHGPFRLPDMAHGIGGWNVIDDTLKNSMFGMNQETFSFNNMVHGHFFVFLSVFCFVLCYVVRFSGMI